jgi:hypothetical protein
MEKPWRSAAAATSSACAPSVISSSGPSGARAVVPVPTGSASRSPATNTSQRLTGSQTVWGLGTRTPNDSTAPTLSTTSRSKAGTRSIESRSARVRLPRVFGSRWTLPAFPYSAARRPLEGLALRTGRPLPRNSSATPPSRWSTPPLGRTPTCLRRVASSPSPARRVLRRRLRPRRPGSRLRPRPRGLHGGHGGRRTALRAALSVVRLRRPGTGPRARPSTRPRCLASRPATARCSNLLHHHARQLVTF